MMNIERELEQRRLAPPRHMERFNGQLKPGRANMSKSTGSRK